MTYLPTKKTILSSIIGTATVALLFTPASVQAQSTVTAIPPRFTVTGDPGEVITTELKVRNDSETSQVYSIIIDDFIVSDSIGTPIPISEQVNNRWSLRNWISAPEIIPVDSNAIQIVSVTIRIPANALPGGHYAMLTYMPNAEIRPGELQKTGSIIGQRVGTLFYVTVSGPITENALLTRFSIPKFLEQGPVDITGSVENLSDVHVNPVGSITISNPLNKKVAELPVEVGNVFPESSRDFDVAWDNKWGWGRYKADLNLSYGSTGGLLNATIFFWLFPIRMVIYILIAIISILLIIIVLNKRNRRHQLELEREVRELKQELEHQEK